MTNGILHIAFLSAKEWDYVGKTIHEPAGRAEIRIGVQDYKLKEEHYLDRNSGDLKTCLTIGDNYLMPDVSAKDWDKALRDAFEKAIDTNFVQVDLVSVQLENAQANTAGRLPPQFEN